MKSYIIKADIMRRINTTMDFSMMEDMRVVRAENTEMAEKAYRQFWKDKSDRFEHYTVVRADMLESKT